MRFTVSLRTNVDAQPYARLAVVHEIEKEGFIKRLYR